MKLFAFLVAITILQSSCASRAPVVNVDTRDAFQVVQEYLKLEQYDEATKYVSDKPQKDAYWAMPTIIQSRICTNVINACDIQINSMQAALKCRNEIELACPITRPPISDHAQQKRSDHIEKLRIAEDSMKPLTFYEKQCESGYRWGYSVGSPKSCFQCTFGSPDLAKLIGKFSDKDKCEEARILANDNSKYRLSDQCLKRYVGENKSTSLWKSKVMNLNGSQSSAFSQDTFELYFDSSDKCEAALIKGLKYITTGSYTEIIIDPYGSSSKSKFIGKCTLVKQSVCTKDKGEVENLPDQIL